MNHKILIFFETSLTNLNLTNFISWENNDIEKKGRKKTTFFYLITLIKFVNEF